MRLLEGEIDRVVEVGRKMQSDHFLEEGRSEQEATGPTLSLGDVVRTNGPCLSSRTPLGYFQSLEHPEYPLCLRMP